MNLVQEIAQSEVPASISNGTQYPTTLAVNGTASPQHKDGGPRQMVAIYDYDPSKDSLNADGAEVELAFRAGDIIMVSGKIDDGFIQVRVGQEEEVVSLGTASL